MTTSNTSARWSKTRDEMGHREYLPFGTAEKVKFILLNAAGEQVDTCTVQNDAATIEDTFNALVKFQMAGSYTYELTARTSHFID